jgi:hypothetical protein
MATSRYIARLMGPVLLIIGIGMVMGMLTEGDAYSSLLKEFIGSRALIFVTGVLALVAGLAIVNAHNLWVPDWRVVITVLGWLFILRGFMNLVFPITVQNLGDRMIASHPGVLAGAAVTIVLGAILSIMGYEDLWLQKSHRRSAARASAPKRSAKRPRRRRA